MLNKLLYVLYYNKSLIFPLIYKQDRLKLFLYHWEKQLPFHMLNIDKLETSITKVKSLF
ncbi:hypothetical protein LDVICp017 [lymphocystis disease virus-China]|uniref:Uncharacterized protein n=1 Tax=lymphocystis disease virus-China TaxID=256729 RepID=Q678J2_9VIRU|nr:hypothetical protein LDVICp017 [lymphocystis disease virus-China]AAU10865.1 hypothetical protein [lymphocystis disease virus-China]